MTPVKAIGFLVTSADCSGLIASYAHMHLQMLPLILCIFVKLCSPSMHLDRGQLRQYVAHMWLDESIRVYYSSLGLRPASKCGNPNFQCAQT
jgi:hypothetical protein